MRNKKMIITLVIMLAIGFASVSATLILNGKVGVGTNETNFVDGVVFSEESLKKTNVETIELSASERTITFITKEMMNVGEEAIVNFKIKNYSQYDVVLGTPAISCYFVENYEEDTKATTRITNEYMQLIPGIQLDGTTITAGGGLSNESNIIVKQIKSYIGDTPMTVKFQCEINATASDNETPSIEKPPVYNVTFNANGGNGVDTILNVKSDKTYGELPTPIKENYEFLGWYTEDGEKVDSTTIVNLQENHVLVARWRNKQVTPYSLINDINWNGEVDIGDEITVGTESFYVISHTATELNALAKYNLKVGNIFSPDGKTKESTISPSEEGYGIQNAKMRGGVSTSEKRYGTVAFSNNNGWPYVNNDTIDIRNQAYGDGPVKDALYGTNGYEKYIKKTIPNSSVRLITKSELETLGCSGDTCTSAPSWVYSTSYWTQSANSTLDRYVWRVESKGIFYRNSFVDNVSYGIRPVITIPL